MNENINKIKEELKAAGAEETEAEELAYFSKNLSNVFNFERSEQTKNIFLEKVGKISYVPKHNFLHVYKPMFASVTGIIFLLSFATFVSAQDSLPGQPLYPVKRISENIISAVNPTFNAEILKRRSWEIKNLSDPDNNEIDNSENVKNTIREYENELREHEDIDIEAIEVSKLNLEDAKEHSLGEDRKEIEEVLRRTERKQEDVKGDSITPSSSSENKSDDWNEEPDKENPESSIRH